VSTVAAATSTTRRIAALRTGTTTRQATGTTTLVSAWRCPSSSRAGRLPDGRQGWLPLNRRLSCSRRKRRDEKPLSRHDCRDAGVEAAVLVAEERRFRRSFLKPEKTFIMDKKPEIIKQIEKLWGKDFELNPAPKQPTTLDGLMVIKTNTPKYAIEGDQLIGLNLAGMDLDDGKWKKIVELLEREGVRLQALNLSGNKLSKFSLSSGLAGLTDLEIEGNPLKSPPEETMKMGKEAVLRFLKELATQGARELFEVKMLIVGEGETGKTTLWNLLQDPNHPVPDPDQKTTYGIKIHEGWEFSHLDHLSDKFLVNLWDFGGQDIQYMTHQFFLTRRSFYVLLADGRQEVANFPYWLEIIQLLGCEPNVKKKLPVLVVLNEKGNPIAKLPYDTETVKDDYPKLNIIRREVDFAIKDDGRLEALTKSIQEVLCHRIGHLPLTIPALWDYVRQELNDLRKSLNHIDTQKFREICENIGITEKQQQDDLSQLFHDLGVILHFREDPTLADFIVLSPQWAVNAVYAIMKHEEIKKVNQGRFDYPLLQQILTKEGYSAGEQANLLNLMLKNNLEVCFRARENGKEIFIAPQLLPENKPPRLKWKKSPETLRYIYHYPFMPKGIIGRLIVRLNEFIESSGKKKVVWEKGMVMQKDNCRAQVQYIEDKKQGRQIIKIEVQGKQAEDRKNVLRDIRQELESIHRRSFPSLRFFQKIPCTCSECGKSIEPFEHDFSELEALKNKGVTTAQCKTSGQNVPIKKLLDGVFKKEEIIINLGTLPKPDEPPIVRIHKENPPWYKQLWIIISGIVIALAIIAQATGNHIGKLLKLLGFEGWD
jgi:internalin A